MLFVYVASATPAPHERPFLFRYGGVCSSVAIYKKQEHGLRASTDEVVHG